MGCTGGGNGSPARRTFIGLGTLGVAYCPCGLTRAGVVGAGAVAVGCGIPVGVGGLAAVAAEAGFCGVVAVAGTLPGLAATAGFFVPSFPKSSSAFFCSACSAFLRRSLCSLRWMLLGMATALFFFLALEAFAFFPDFFSFATASEKADGFSPAIKAGRVPVRPKQAKKTKIKRSKKPPIKGYSTVSGGYFPIF